MKVLIEQILSDDTVYPLRYSIFNGEKIGATKKSGIFYKYYFLREDNKLGGL